MALALAESLIACDGLDETDLMRRFVSWWRDGAYSPLNTCFDIGATTADALARFERSGNPLSGSTDPWTAGNGSLMRLAPVAIFGGTSTRDNARRQSATTHGADACLDACEGFAMILQAALSGQRFEVASSAARGVGAGAVQAVFNGSWRDKTRQNIASSGYVVHSLEASLWCVSRTETFREAVLLAANLGDDADTTAAITGQLAGALYGADGIPADWLNMLAWRERIEELASALQRTPA